LNGAIVGSTHFCVWRRRISPLEGEDFDAHWGVIVASSGTRRSKDLGRGGEQYGDAKLTDLLHTLADCPKARSASIHDRCKAVYGQRLP
jgi:hypothetical protein